MRIKTQFVLTMVIFGVTLAVIGTSLITTVRQMAQLDREEEIAIEIGQGMTELGYLSSDYLLYREALQLQRWETMFALVSQEVARLEPATADERMVRDQLETSLTRFQSVFYDISQPAEATQSTGISSDAYFQMSWSRLAVPRQNTAFEAVKLLRSLRERKAYVSQRNVALVGVILFLFAVFFVTNYVIVYRQTLSAMAHLRAGTRVVGSGDLDYAIPVTRNDEIGELSRAFNRMTADLKGVIISKSLLEREVVERERVEAELRESLQRIRELIEARERELETTKLLLEASHTLTEWTDLSHVLEALADIVLESTGHTRVTVQMWDDMKHQLEAVVVRGDATLFPHQGTMNLVDLSEPARSVIETLRTAVIDYDALPADNKGLADAIGSHLALLIPLVYRQKLVGLVRVDDPGSRRDFNDREIALVQGIAAQAAVAVENARHYDEERQVAEALRAVFKKPVPDIPGVSLGVVGHYANQAGRVGGDFYDAFVIDGQVVVLIGDVAGKGLAAVGLTERVSSAVRALAYGVEELSPARLLTRTNRSLMWQLAPDEFVTAVILTIHPRTGAYRIAAAGHPLPYFCGEPCRQVEIPSGPPLGVIDVDYQEVSGTLARGETIVLYTDGVTEARRDSDFFGEDRLVESLTTPDTEPKKTAEELFTSVEEYARGRLVDDLLILALRLDDRSAD